MIDASERVTVVSDPDARPKSSIKSPFSLTTPITAAVSFVPRSVAESSSET
ncbi:MAG: hypothetical protein IIC84_06265 [Chloroflexi bacterium]|nr:hypothetical protein [Chloroflexota bacterium]